MAWSSAHAGHWHSTHLAVPSAGSPDAGSLSNYQARLELLATETDPQGPIAQRAAQTVHPHWGSSNALLCLGTSPFSEPPCNRQIVRHLDPSALPRIAVGNLKQSAERLLAFKVNDRPFCNSPCSFEPTAHNPRRYVITFVGLFHKEYLSNPYASCRHRRC
jgi:hypothetical protein